MTGKRALVTGATGFVGSHLTRRLIREGWNVHIIVRPGSNLSVISDWVDQVHVICHDGTTAHMIQIMKEVTPETVFHLASLFLARHKPEEIELLIQSNVLFSTQLLEGMAYAGVRRLINTGTAWQHYNNNVYSPVCLYAATKQAYEALMKYYEESASIRMITLKLCDTYGPMDRRAKLFHLLGETHDVAPLAMSAGEQQIDLVYIDDVVEAYQLAAERLDSNRMLQGHERYAVTSAQPLPLRKVVELYEEVAGRKLPIQWGALPYRPREMMKAWSGGAWLPGWQPRIGLEEGIRRVLAAASTG